MTAAFTIVRNEPLFLPLWLAYYGRQFGLENLFVLDHGSDDGSTTGLPCEVVPVANPVCYDHEWLVAVAAQFMAERFAAGAEAVLYTDVDEMLVHPFGLRGFAEAFRGSACRAKGYHLIEIPGEAPYDATRPILEQRGCWARDQLYDKTLLAREPVQWEVGFHYLAGKTNAPYADGLTLVHLHQFDRGLARARHEARRGWVWHEEQREARNSEQWTFEGERLEAWMNERAAVPAAVPAWLKEQGAF